MTTRTASARSLLTLALLVVPIVAANAQKEQSPDEGAVIPGRVIVKVDPTLFASGLTPHTIEAACADAKVRRIHSWLRPEILSFHRPLFRTTERTASLESSLRRIQVVEYDGGLDPRQIARRLSRISGVEYAEPQYRRQLLYMPNDLRISAQWYLQRTGAFEAWDIQRGDSEIVVGMVDAGIEADHPDLVDAIWHNPGETGGGKATNGVDDDGNGFIDDTWGWDFSGPDGMTPDNDPDNRNQNHGTLTAGCVAATGDNNIGIAGIAYGVKVMAVKVTDDAPSSTLSHEPEGILYAAKMGAKVINCSFGGPGKSRSEAELVRVVQEAYDAVIVAACGNNGMDQLYYPASYPGVISVAWTQENDDRSSLSNYGYRVDLSAPGENILSTGSGDYIYDSGTSYSAPLVSGAAALIRLKWPEMDRATVSELLRASTDDNRGSMGPQYADKMGAGRLNVGTAMQFGTSVQSARLASWEIIEEQPDGFIEPGESIRIHASVRNFLADAATVVVVVAPVDPVSVTIAGPRLDLGRMTSGETRSSPDTVFSITVPPTMPMNSSIVLRFTTATPDRANDQFIAIPIAPTWRTTDNNDIALTFNSTGNLGYNGINRAEGDGMSYRTQSNLLYHGGVMAALDSAHISDVVRRGRTSSGVNDGFHFTERYGLAFLPDSSVETGEAQFTDFHRPVDSMVGLEVRMRTYQYKRDDARNFVIVRYRLTNPGTGPVQNLHFGLYLDFDVSSGGGSDRIVWDSTHALGLVYDSRISNSTYVGATLLSAGEPLFYGADNTIENVVRDFTFGAKWKMLSSGIRTFDTVGDVGMTIGYSGVTIPGGKSIDLGFAIAAASTADSLRLAAVAAREYFERSEVEADKPAIVGAALIPNPFRWTTRGVVDISRPGRVTATIVTIDGRDVKTVHSGQHGKGRVEFDIDLRVLPAGTYFIRIDTPDGMTTVRGIRTGP